MPPAWPGRVEQVAAACSARQVRGPCGRRSSLWPDVARREKPERSRTSTRCSCSALISWPARRRATEPGARRCGANAAERERVSLNQFITDALSGSLGWRAPNRETARATRVVPKEQLEGEPGTSRWQERPRVTNAVFMANVVIVAVAAIVAIVVLIATLR